MRLRLAIFALWSTLATVALAAGPSPGEGAQPQPVALVTGSDRGIGLALTEELVRRGWRVVATCRHPARARALQAFAAAHSGVTLERLDVSDDAAIDGLARKYRDQPIDVLVNNAGITGDLTRQHLGTIEVEGFEQVMKVNAYAPLRIAQAFLGSVAASRQKKEDRGNFERCRVSYERRGPSPGLLLLDEQERAQHGNAPSAERRARARCDRRDRVTGTS